MFFYCFELDTDSKHITTTMHPDGTLLEYNYYLMGLHTSPNACQAATEKIAEGLELTVYIDSIGYWSNGLIQNTWLS